MATTPKRTRKARKSRPGTADRLDLTQVHYGQSIDGVFVLSDLTVKMTKKKDPMLLIEIANGPESRMPGVVWKDGMPMFDGLVKNQAVRVKGHVKPGYHTKFEIEIDTVEAADDNHPVRSFINPVCPEPVEKLEARFQAAAAEIERKAWVTFLRRYFDEACPWDQYKIAPAAIQMHHAYVHGLLEHSVEVAEAVIYHARAPKNRGKVDLDLLIVAALLHDSGKVFEYEYDGVPFDMATEGRFFGHITKSPILVDRVWQKHGDELRAGGLTEEDYNHLLHLLVSHHGCREYGSPTEPASLEADILHYADDTSAKTQGRLEAPRSEKAREIRDGWIDCGYPYKKGVYVSRPGRERGGR